MSDPVAMSISLKRLQQIPEAQNEPFRKNVVTLDGKLITSEDPLAIGKNNFRTLVNMRYGNASPKSVAGMTKINTTALSAYPIVRSAIHFRKNFEGTR
jgi:hypothetical protein